jgi:hypothetical protein
VIDIYHHGQVAAFEPGNALGGKYLERAGPAGVAGELVAADASRMPGEVDGRAGAPAHLIRCLVSAAGS